MKSIIEHEATFENKFRHGKVSKKQYKDRFERLGNSRII